MEEGATAPMGGPGSQPRVAGLRRILHDIDLEAVKEFNAMLADAKRRPPVHIFHPLDFSDACVIAVGDASFGQCRQDQD